MYKSNLETIGVNQYIFNHKKEFNIEIGLKIKQIRTSKNITTEQMAFRTMMSPSYIMQIENGTNGVTLNKFVIICNALEIEPKEILDDFLFGPKTNEDLIYEELQKGKNISKNILDYLIKQKSGYQNSEEN